MSFFIGESPLMVCVFIIAYAGWLVKGEFHYPEGNVVKTIDNENQKEYNYIYDEGKLIRAVEYDVTIENDVVTSKTKVVSIVYVYNEEGELVKRKAAYPDGKESGNTPTLNDSESVDSSTFYSNVCGTAEFHSVTKTDGLGRRTEDYISTVSGRAVGRSFTYVEGKTPTELGGYNEHVLSQNKVNLAQDKYKPTTQLVKNITVKDDESTLHTFSYEYDEEERIKKLVETYTVNGEIITDTTEYEYDALGQLLTETKNDTVINAMTYDGYGNILTKNGNTYGYINAAWDDLLTHYNGQQITYDEQGNPTTYRGKSLVWEKGRQLRSYDGITYTYNANGIRTSKTIGNVKHTYVLDGTKILKETLTDVSTGNVVSTIIPLYDNEDNVCGICYNGKSYYFVKNLQGDVVSLVTKEEVDGEVVYTIVANYTYDAWGVCTVVSDSTDVSIATINPFRYRGYYYDVETGLYYLQSRYYDPEVGRFINGDEAENLKLSINVIEYSLYTYCNNSINNYEIDGFFSLKGVFKAIKKYVSLGRGKISFKLPYKISIIFGAFVLVSRFIFTKSDIKDIHKITDNKFATMIVAALPYGSAYLTSEIIAWLCNVGAVVAGMMAVLSFVMSCCTGGVFNIAKTVFIFLLSYILPTVIAAVQMVYFGFKKKRGCVYTIKLLGGSSVSF